MPLDPNSESYDGCFSCMPLSSSRHTFVPTRRDGSPCTYWKPRGIRSTSATESRYCPFHSETSRRCRAGCTCQTDARSAGSLAHCRLRDTIVAMRIVTVDAGDGRRANSAAPYGNVSKVPSRRTPVRSPNASLWPVGLSIPTASKRPAERSDRPFTSAPTTSGIPA